MLANNILALLTIVTSFHVPLGTHTTSYAPESQSVWVKITKARAQKLCRLPIRRIYRKLARRKGSGSLRRITVFVRYEDVVRLLRYCLE